VTHVEDDNDRGSEPNLACGMMEPPLPPQANAADSRSVTGWSVVWARLLVGMLVLICAEVFSGASLQVGLWHPWTLLMTYWLYFAHFFTTLAVRTGRTSFWSLYLWGVLFGLYESWITKVIWYGYSGDGNLVLGSIGPYGISEMSGGDRRTLAAPKARAVRRRCGPGGKARAQAGRPAIRGADGIGGCAVRVFAKSGSLGRHRPELRRLDHSWNSASCGRSRRGRCETLAQRRGDGKAS